jgi:hypothetical protein
VRGRWGREGGGGGEGVGGGGGGEGAIGDQGSASIDTSERREGTANGMVYVRAGVYIITHVSHPFTWFPVPGWGWGGGGREGKEL